MIAALELLQVWIDAQLAYEQLPGISVAVVHDQDLLWSRGFGYSDVEARAPVSPQTIFSICSVSKLFTSIAVMQLRDAGMLNLDDPVEKHLPWFDIEQTYADVPPATVRSLLTHTSGLPRESPFPYWTDPTFPFPTREAMMERVGSQHTLYPTDRYYQYSNFGMSLLGEIVGAASGMPYDSYIRQRILEPLGMADTTTDIPVHLAGGRLATGYSPLDRSGQRHELASFQTRAIAPAAGYASTVEDLARFVSWQFSLLGSAWGEIATSRAASILHPNTLREMQRVHRVDPELSAGEGSRWGLGFGIYAEDDQQYVGHGGACPGYRTSLRLQPDTKVATIAMINAEGLRASPSRITRRAHQIVGTAIAEATESPGEASIPDPGLRRYTGLYSTVAWGEAAIVIHGGQLAHVYLPTADPLGGLTKLQKTGEHRFRRVRDDGELGEEWLFELENDAVVRMWVNSQYSTKVR
ncbi:MAG TPA: serine hydrolase domain-containing protein [Acidobacteriota bacterium]|nr:serine hydrolase domain-containing protein [Acidobacteriota bacterium]